MSLNYPELDRFRDKAVAEMLGIAGKVVDISGSLRGSRSKGDSFSIKLAGRYVHLVKNNNQYIGTDYTDKSHPDRVQDIHSLSYANNFIDVIFYLFGMGHIKRSVKAVAEIFRVLKARKDFFYLPFPYWYHSHSTECRDFDNHSRRLKNISKNQTASFDVLIQ